MKIAVIGSGGVGGYFGARLAAGGSSVTFVARGRQSAALKRNGLSIQSSRGNLHLEAIRVVEDIAKVGPVDLAVIAVKLWDTEEVGKAVKSLVDEGASVLSLQNGVEKDDVLRRYETVTTLYVRTQFIAGPPSELPTNRPVLRNKRALPYEAIGPRSSHTPVRANSHAALCLCR
jgi:2-dehydropantoate 2-reductase